MGKSPSMEGNTRLNCQQQFYAVLVISFLARFITTSTLLPRIHEFKHVHKGPHFLYFVTMMPARGIMFDSVVGMNRTIKAFKDKLENIQKNLDKYEKDLKGKTKQ